MKIFIKLLLLLLVLGIAAPFVIKGPNNQPLLSTDKLSMPSLSSLTSTSPTTEEVLSGKTKTASIQWSKDQKVADTPAHTVYIIDKNESPKTSINQRIFRWKNSQGKWQFSDEPNPNGPSIVVELANTTNTMAPVDTKKLDNALANTNSAFSSNSFPSPTTIPAAQIPELIKQAKAVQGLMDNRGKMLEEM